MNVSAKRGTRITLLFLAFWGASKLNAQDIPAGPTRSLGFSLPSVGGSLHYSLSVSEAETFGYSGESSTTSSANIAGNVGYLSQSTSSPFSLVYSGGYQRYTGGNASSTFQSLSMSQVLTAGRWSGIAADSVSYLPEAAVTGLSGIPGLGDLGAIFGPNLPGFSGLQSTYSPQVSNTVSASVSRAFTPRVSISGTGSMGIQRFVSDVTGVENNTYAGSLAVSRRLSSVSQISASYFFNRFSYVGLSERVDSQGLAFQYSRTVSPRLSYDFSIGPQFSSIEGEPSQLNYTVGADVSYNARLARLSASYSRATSSGSGVTSAIFSNTLSGAASHPLTRSTQVSVSAGYSQSSSLPTTFQLPYSFTSVYGSAQVAQSFSRVLSGFASYTVQHQLQETNAFARNGLTGVQQTLSFGLTYSPQTLRLGR